MLGQPFFGSMSRPKISLNVVNLFQVDSLYFDEVIKFEPTLAQYPLLYHHEIQLQRKRVPIFL